MADEWRADRPARQARRGLDPADFERLRGAGFSVAVPRDMGGLWRSVAETTRADLRTAADARVRPILRWRWCRRCTRRSSAFWLAPPDRPSTAWERAARRRCSPARPPAQQWGTITSEPGSGGDILPHQGAAHRPTTSQRGTLPGATYRVTGDKHFGSGSGVTSFMITTAVPEGEDAPTLFALDVRDRPWDGSSGLRLTAEWDGVGMAATQSHAMRLEGCPADPHAPGTGRSRRSRSAAAPLIASLFTAVILGVFDEAIAHRQSAARAEGRRRCGRTSRSSGRGPSSTTGSPCRRYEGALRAVESRRPRAIAARRAAGEGGRGGTGRSVARPPGPRDRRRDVLAPIAVRVVVRRRPRARLPPAAVGPRLRQPVRSRRSADQPSSVSKMLGSWRRQRSASRSFQGSNSGAR